MKTTVNHYQRGQVLLSLSNRVLTYDGLYTVKSVHSATEYTLQDRNCKRMPFRVSLADIDVELA